MVPTLKWWHVLLGPAIGGAFVGPLVYFLAREAKGHGVPEVMNAVAMEGGIIRKRVVVIKTLASAMCIGSGGSVGREGPIVQIGSAIGSSLGQILRVTDDEMRILVGCGAAAGIAATFNAPIAGAIFALEIVLADFALTTFTPIILSSVMATVVSRSFLGNAPAFQIPHYQLESPVELGFYVVLGLVAGCVAVAFTTILYKSEDKWDALRIPEYLKATIGGLMIGALGLYFPQLLGVGYEAIDTALQNRELWLMLLLLGPLKIIATSITIGSGGSGGIFAPSLFMGAMAGGAFGCGIHALFPGFTAQPGAYALVGMGAVVCRNHACPDSGLSDSFRADPGLPDHPASHDLLCHFDGCGPDLEEGVHLYPEVASPRDRHPGGARRQYLEETQGRRFHDPPSRDHPATDSVA